MGRLLDFSSAMRDNARASAPARSRSLRKNRDGGAGGDQRQGRARGELIFFPGVRYQRHPLETSSRIGTIEDQVLIRDEATD